MSMMAERVMGAAQRRRERQLRAFHRHEVLSVKMALATGLHHSAQRVEVPREVEEHETYVGPRAQKTPPPGMRPASLAEPRGSTGAGQEAQRRAVWRTRSHGADPRCSCAADGGPACCRACPLRLAYPRARHRSAQDFVFTPLFAHSSSLTAAGGTVGGRASAFVPPVHANGLLPRRRWPLVVPAHGA